MAIEPRQPQPIERHGGDVWVEPALYLLGTVIAVTLVSALSVLLYLT